MELPLVTERLTLRAFDPVADLAAMHAIYGDPEVMRWVLGGRHAGEQRTARVLRSYAEQQQRTGWSVWAVVENDSGALIGDCGLFPFADPHPRIELGYTLAHAARGRGLATEAAGAAVAFAFEELGLFELVAVVRPENAASRRVLDKLGFVAEGTRVLGGERHDALVLVRP